MKHLLIIGLLVIFVHPLSAQVRDTTEKFDASEIHTYSIDNPEFEGNIDTALEEFYNYRLTGSLNNYYLDLGNYGSAAYLVNYHPNYVLGTNLGINSWNVYESDIRNLHLYRPEHPFTNLQYVQGISGEQVFGVTHAENIRNRFTFGIDYYGIRSPDVYLNQMAKSNSATLYADYKSKNQRYRASTVYISNHISNLMNGGVSDSDFFTASPKSTVGVYLNHATSELGGQSLLVKQSFNVGSPIHKILNDTENVKVYEKPWSVYHELILTKNSYDYKDVNPDTGYYPSFFLRLDSTLDLTLYRSMENRVGLQFNKHEINANSDSLANYYGQIYSIQQWVDIDQQGRQYIRRNYFAGFNFNYRKTRTDLDVSGMYDLSGSDAGTYNFKAIVRLSLSKWAEFGLDAEMAKSAAPFVAEHYLSNHYFFNKEFGPISWMRFGLNYRIPAIHNDLTFNYDRILGQVVYDSLSSPKQIVNPVSIWQVAWNAHFSFRHFHLINHILIQISSQADSIPLPRWSSRHSLYYEAPMFKNAIKAQTGLQVSYHSAWYAPAFNTALGQYYLQNQVLLSTYPVVDLFFSFRLNIARIFFIGENLNQGILFPAGYYASPGYPSNDRTFRFGVSWLLFN